MQGLLLLNKDEGITSFGAVSKIKRLTKEKRVGHTGTLDPMATGVLPIFIGRATALSSYLLDADKTYEATVLLGVNTDTYDITGNVIKTSPVNVTNDNIVSVLNGFKGESYQTPPMYSAIKKDGRKLYELARKGEETEITKRKINIKDIFLTNNLTENNTFSFTATVSKGTYIRSLAKDIGDILGCGATLKALKRTSASGFMLDECVRLSDLTEETVNSFILSEETAVLHLKRAFVTAKQGIRFTNGGQLFLDRIKFEDGQIPEDGTVLRVISNNIFLGLGIVETEKNLLSVKCIVNYLK